MSRPVENAGVRPGLRRTASSLLLALAASAFLPACDNPACVFGPDGCTGRSSGSTSTAAPATVPVDGQWIELGPPTIAARIPSGSTTLAADSPMALVFSESMASASLSNSLRLQDSASGGFGVPITFASTLLSDGRILVILPAQPLTLDTEFNLVWADDATPVDLQGEPLAIPEDRVAATFTTAATAPATVRLLGSFPANLSQNQSGIGEFVALFDRRINVSTVNPTSFDFKVGGANPPNDPLATPVSISSGTTSLTDTRAFRWRSVDSNGTATPLTPGQEVDVSLSPVGFKIAAVDGSLLATQHVRYDIAAISPAQSAVVVSLPNDAIGIDNLFGPKTLDIQVDLASAQVGDRLGIFLFGNSVGADPKRLALFRDLQLGTTATTVHIGEDEVDLGASQGIGRLADGTLSIAIRMQRGSATTPVRLLDADVLADGIQSLVLDLTRPTLTGLGPSGSSQTAFRSDLRDFALVGRASERIRSVEVSTSLGNNGVLPAVLGSTAGGLFVAAPVLVGTLTPAQNPLAFTAQIYDDALNAAETQIGGSFTQFGASGPGNPPTGSTITVDVFDASNFVPLSNVRVMTHEDLGGGQINPLDVDTTDPQGRVTLNASNTGETFVTVDAGAFDLFTFEDVPTDRLSVPLTHKSTPPGTVVGTASSADSDFGTFDRFVVDSRRILRLDPLIAVQSCLQNPVTHGQDCAFGPSPIRPNLMGVATLFAVEIPPSELSYNAVSFLRGFQLVLPVAQIGGGGVSNVKLAANTLLDDPATALEDRTIDGPALPLDLNGVTGLLIGSLSGDPAVRVEARVRGVPGSAVVGLGVAFDQGGNVWNMRSAYPGVADGIQDTPQDALGTLVADGVIDADLQLACEVRDTLGARAGRRTRFSQLGAQLEPTSPPTIVSPLPGANTGGPSFDLVFANAIPDSAGTPGMYLATLTATGSGRRWTLWRPDLGNGSGPTRTIHVPDLAALGGNALPDGPITATVEAFGYPTFDLASFQWSDIEREYDSFSASAPSAFTQP